MSSEYTKVLLVIFILLVLSAGLWILQSYATEETEENFITDQTFASQKRFIDDNIAKAKVGDGAVDVFYPPYPDDLKRATEDIDLFAKRQRPPTEKWYSNVYSAEILKKEKQCAAIERPDDLPDDATKQRMDCAWMFNPEGRSGATLCSVAGPIFSFARKQYPSNRYKFIWSKGEAIKKERIKQCALTKNCSLLIPGTGCGFCPELGYAVPVNGDGSSTYGEAKCPYNAVTDPAWCARPRAEGGAGISGAENTSICNPDSQGRLSKSCLSALARQASCTDAGTMLQALNDSSNPELSSKQVRDIAGVMRSYNFSIPDSLLQDGNIVVDSALSTYINISKASQNAQIGRVRKAAGNLCTGTPFHQCDYDDNSKENFTLSCLQDLYQQAGCQGKGSDFPTATNLPNFYGRTWGNIRATVNEISNRMTNTQGRFTPEQQKEAILKCIGTRLRKKPIGYCNELGISVKIYFGVQDKAHYYGRRILTNQFFMLRNDSTLWDSLDFFESSWRNGDVLLVIEANINPESDQTLNFTRVGNAPDVIKWNDVSKVSKSSNGLAQDPVHGLTVTKNRQQDQRLRIDLVVPGSQQVDRSTIWYLVDSNNTIPPVTMFRLPMERKNPILNITMNGGPVSEITSSFVISPVNVQEGNRGGKSCTIFNGVNSYVKIENKLRNKAFRSYTMKFFSESLGNCTRLFQFYNGGWKPRWQWYSWGWWWGGWYYTWTYDTEDYGIADVALDVEFGYQSTQISGQFKTPWWGQMVGTIDNGLKLNTWQHLTFVWNDDYSGYSLFLDGEKKASASGKVIPEQFTHENFVGKGYFDGWTGMFKGGVEWFRGFDYPLGPDEIQQDMDDDW